MKKITRTLIGTLALLAALPASASVLTGGNAAGNSNDGIMFDLFARSAATLQSFDINADFGTFDYTVYYRQGSVADALGDASAWTELGRFGGLTTAGIGSATRLDFTDLLLTGGLYGFYVTDQGAFSVQYTNSTAPAGTVQASSGPLDLHVGYGVTAPFADATPDRAFNGAINFAAASAVPEPASWAMLLIGFGALGTTLRRRRPAPRLA